jgi:choline dehydrogenase-like flavoprotein
MLVDARRRDQITGLDYDLIVVGSGFAGLAIVDRFRDSGVSVCLIESGGRYPELRTQRLYRAENIGDPYFRLDSCRSRMFGGSGNLWGGMCRPLDPIDFEARDGIPESGWPISYSDLTPYFEDAATLLQLPAHVDQWSGRFTNGGSFGVEDFEDVVIQHGAKVSFAEVYGSRILAAANITTMLHANVTELVMEPGSRRVAGASVQPIGGSAFVVRAKAVVLATGGIENARLLLASNRQRGAGIGNEFDLVGRYFMEHLQRPGGHIADVVTGRPQVYEPPTDGHATARAVVSPSSEALRRHGLPNCSISIEDAGYSRVGRTPLSFSPTVTTLPLSVYHRVRDVNPAVAKQVRNAAAGQWGALRVWQTSRVEQRARVSTASTAGPRAAPMLSTYIRAEQTPNACSRVTLDARRDLLGVPRSRLDWRVAESDRAAMTRWLERFGRTVERPEIGGRYVPDDVAVSRITGGPHHMGTTRMAAVPSKGVVDATCRVHTTDNLYVAGSSVFTTSGWANPTFTIVALALRLADHLLRQMSETSRLTQVVRS